MHNLLICKSKFQGTASVSLQNVHIGTKILPQTLNSELGPLCFPELSFYFLLYQEWEAVVFLGW